MNFSPLQTKILQFLGLKDSEEIASFLSPSYETGIHDPFLLPDMERACERIERAIDNKERIVVYGDYDADGIPAATLLYELFKKIGVEVEVYIPNRNRDGFGINPDAARELSERADLVISVDCGSADFEAADIFKEKGIDLIITDHHSVHEMLPNAYAVVNPKRRDSTYPFPELCGSGVAWKLASGLLKRRTYELPKGWEKWLLGMATIGTICDMVPLQGENRVIATFGIKVLRKLPSPGWKALLEVTKINQTTLTEDDIAFSIGPRLNAASRMGDARDAFKLLSADTLIEGKRLAQNLESLNNKRKGSVAAIVRQAHEHIKNESKNALPVIVVGDPNWKPSLLGLAASSIAEEFKKPAFLWGREEAKEIKGSCRSGGVIDVFELMSKVPEGIFSHYGGHVHAGGFALPNENIFDLESALVRASESTNVITEEEGSPVIEIECSDVSPVLLSFLSKLSPFGTGNIKPTFCLKGSVRNFERFGKASEHAKFLIENKGKSLRVIHFKAPDGIIEGESVELKGNLEVNSYGGRDEIRVRIGSECNHLYKDQASFKGM